MSQIVNIRCSKTAVVQFLQVSGRLVIASDEQSWVRRFQLSAVVLVKSPHLAVFNRHRHAFQVSLVPYGLKIAATYQQVDFDVFFFSIFSMAAYGFQLAVATPLDGNLHVRFFFFFFLLVLLFTTQCYGIERVLFDLIQPMHLL